MDDSTKRKPSEKRYKEARLIPAAAMAITAAALLAAYRAVIGSPAATERCIMRFSRPVRAALGSINAHIPLSVMELMYVAAFLWLVGHIVRTVRICRGLRGAGGKIWRSLARRALLLIAVCALLLAGYCWLWGLDYHGKSFTERSGLQPRPVDAATLYRVTEYFLENANELSALMPRAEDGSFQKSKREILDEFDSAYTAAENIFPCLAGVSRHPKPMVASKFMSWTGFTGVYFPYTGESNINVDSPASLMALTVAHELAHQRGVYAEDECNFIGVMACVTCDNEVYRYSGYFGGLIYLMNELYELDKEAWMELRGSFSPQLEQDWLENNAYWQRYEGAAEEIAGELYDGYLKANGQEMGIRSYDACVTLIAAYFGEKVS